MVEAFISSEKAAPTLAVGETPVAPAWGTVLVTLGVRRRRDASGGYVQGPTACDLSGAKIDIVYDVKAPGAVGVGVVEGGERRTVGRQRVCRRGEGEVLDGIVVGRLVGAGTLYEEPGRLVL
jgi:hypothetical protein